ncbi:MAG: hypothetical protein DSY42_01040 [Aquifex sp.]|nr:MAG: hypothetical protein DSY42_01040 [Aquifex sp.]
MSTTIQRWAEKIFCYFSSFPSIPEKSISENLLNVEKLNFFTYQNLSAKSYPFVGFDIKFKGSFLRRCQYA